MDGFRAKAVWVRVIESDLYFKKVILATVLRIDWRSIEEESSAGGSGDHQKWGNSRSILELESINYQQMEGSHR